MTTLGVLLAIATAVCILTAIAEAVLELDTESHDMDVYRVLSTIGMSVRTRGAR